MKTLTKAESRLKNLIADLRSEIEGIYIENIYKSLEEMERSDIKIETDCEGWNNYVYETFRLINIDFSNGSDNDILQEILEVIADTDECAEAFIEWHNEKLRYPEFL